jgi:hypothetical protein
MDIFYTLSDIPYPEIILLLIINHVQQNANRVMMVKQLKEKYVKQNVLNVKNVQKQSHV